MKNGFQVYSELKITLPMTALLQRFSIQSDNKISKGRGGAYASSLNTLLIKPA